MCKSSGTAQHTREMDVLDLHARKNVGAHINQWTHGLIHMLIIFLLKIERTGMANLNYSNSIH
jgi:hypothetical protein